MKKILLALALCVGLLAGCSGDTTTITDSKGNSESISTFTYTDPDTGCKYIVFDWYQGGGASPKLDENGKPTGCKNLE